jgi:hypothetical protein
MLGAGAHLAARLDLAAFAHMTAEPREVLVVNMFDVVDGKLRYLPAGRIASSTGASATTAATWATSAIAAAFTFATLALWTAEA